MRFSASWVVALVVLGGCASAPEPGESPEPQAPDDVTEDGVEGEDEEVDEPGPETGSNTPPTPAIDAPTEAVVATEFALNLTAQDADGDPLEWTLHLAGQEVAAGTALPAQHTHTFDAVGQYAFTFNVTDEMDIASVRLNVSVAEPAPVLTIAGTTTLTGSPVSSGIVSGAAPGLGAKACTGFLQGDNEVDCVYGALPADMEGRAYTFAGEGSNPDHEFLASCEPTADVVQGYADTGEEGVIPADAGCVVMWFFSGSTGPLQVDVF